MILENLVPRPRSISYPDGLPFRFTPARPCILGAEAEVRDALETLRQGLAPHLNQGLEISESSCGNIAIKHDKDTAREGYRIRIEAEGIHIASSTVQGARNGAATLLQILRLSCSDSLNFSEAHLPACHVEDAPRFPWRGMHLDVARTFFPPTQVKRFIDLLAIHRFNVLHWHLTDDQGWRVESRRFPRLTEVGSQRNESPRAGDRNAGDGKPCGGFYTQDEISNIVQYATLRGIDILPEINFPGHSAASLAAYPELGNTDIADYRPEVLTRWGIHPWVLGPKPTTFSFIENLYEEVAGLFPFSHFHIGGDEVLDGQWKHSPSAQDYIRTHGLGNEEGLFRHFVHFSAKVLRQLGKRCVGWDEIVENEPPPDAVATVWRNWEIAQKALAAGCQVIMAPKTHAYFDYYQADPSGEPEAIGGHLPLEQVATFNPIPPETPPEQTHMILGGQGQLWSEYLRDWSQVEYMALPRMCALAEILWSGPIDDPAALRKSLGPHLEVLGKSGFRYRPLSPEPIAAAS